MMHPKDLPRARRVYATLPDPRDATAPGVERVYYDLVTREAKRLGCDGVVCVKIRKAGDLFDVGSWYPLAALQFEE